MSAKKKAPAEFIVGIDLGTTHSALAFTRSEEPVGVLPIPQLVSQGTVEAKALLPSFHYFAHESDGAQALPWDETRRYAVGEHARVRGVDAPARVVSSAKSWLSHSGIDRRGEVLPLGAPEDITKISPVTASERYLRHLAEAWRARHPDAPLEEQDVVLTVPASFDAGARDLTVEAARLAGLERLTLLEEPQAALYAWIEQRGDAWRKDLKVGDVILVIDVGGGTTDFSAIAATDVGGSLDLLRVAVGEHILLGGDNMDLALAHVLRQKLEAEGRTLDRWQMTSLTFACRAAKERLYEDPSLTTIPITVASRGSKLLGGSIRTELTQEELGRTLTDGFFPLVPRDARPAVRPRTALTQLGLPYAQDAAVTRHLAAFLGKQAGVTAKLEGFSAKAASGEASMLHPTCVLFNGGVMKAAALRDRILGALNAWLAEEGAPPVRVLEGADLDLSVARGAAAYGVARRGRGVRIRGGTARSYYVGIEGAVPAVPGMEPPITAMCLAPFGMEEGTSASLPGHELGVVVGEKVRFRFFGSTVRRDDRAGVELESWKEEELEELAPIEVTLPAEGRKEGDVVPVVLQAQVTEVGTLRLEAVATQPQSTGERWAIELNVRSEA